MMEGRANEMPDFQVFRTVLSYCVVIIVVPVVVFFASKSLVMDALLGLDNVASNVYAAVAAIIVLHVALALFIVRAYREVDKPDRAPKPAKID